MSIRRKYEKPAVSADYFYMSQVRYGSQYAAKQLKLSLAKLGITVCHAPIKSGKSKGKMLYDGFFIRIIYGNRLSTAPLDVSYAAKPWIPHSLTGMFRDPDSM